MLNTKVRKHVATKCAKKMRKSVGKCSTQKCVNVCCDKKTLICGKMFYTEVIKLLQSL